MTAVVGNSGRRYTVRGYGTGGVGARTSLDVHSPQAAYLPGPSAGFAPEEASALGLQLIQCAALAAVGIGHLQEVVLVRAVSGRQYGAEPTPSGRVRLRVAGRGGNTLIGETYSAQDATTLGTELVRAAGAARAAEAAWAAASEHAQRVEAG